MSEHTVVYQYTPERLAEPGYIADVPPRDLTELDVALLPPDILREVRGSRLYTAVEEDRAAEDAAATGQPQQAITVGEGVPVDLLTPAEQATLVAQEEARAEAEAAAAAAAAAEQQVDAPKKAKKGAE